jgi:hypothetical protein
MPPTFRTIGIQTPDTSPGREGQDFCTELWNRARWSEL